MATFTKDAGVVRTKRAWLFLALLAVGVLPFMAVVNAVLAGHWFAFVPYYTAIFGAGHLWHRRWRERRGRVRANEEGLFIGDELVVARASVRHGHLLRRGDDLFVRLGRGLRPIDIAVSSEEEGNALLNAMRLDASRSVGTYTMTDGTFVQSLVRVLGAILPLAAAIALTSVLLPLHVGGFAMLFYAAAYSAYALNQYLRIAVGADGIRIRRLLSPRSRFVPFSAMVSAETDGRNIAIHLRDGEVLHVHHPPGKGWKFKTGAHDTAEDGRMLVARVNEGIARQRGGASNVAGLARGERDTQEWMRDVSLVTDEHASFRAPAIPPDELWRVVEDPAAEATTRAAAALALRSRLDDDGRTRLRVAADACAAPKLRVALQATASVADEAELEDAFDELDDELSARRASRAL